MSKNFKLKLNILEKYYLSKYRVHEPSSNHHYVDAFDFFLLTIDLYP